MSRETDIIPQVYIIKVEAGLVYLHCRAGRALFTNTIVTEAVSSLPLPDRYFSGTFILPSPSIKPAK